MDIQTQSGSGQGAELIPLDPAHLGSQDGLAVCLYSESVRANCTSTCNIQAGLKVCGTNTHLVSSRFFFS